jgi:ParB/RepB/Spo0J family partition protein
MDTDHADDTRPTTSNPAATASDPGRAPVPFELAEIDAGDAYDIPLDLIDESPLNHRTIFRRLEELAESIGEHGIKRACLARPSPTTPGRIELVYGHRRRRAVKLRAEGLLAAGQPLDRRATHLPCRIRELTDFEVLLEQAMENLDREDPHPLEEALIFEKLHEPKAAGGQGLSLEEISAKLHKSISHIVERLKLTALCPEARAAFMGEEIAVGHAFLLARIATPELQIRLLLKHLEGLAGKGELLGLTLEVAISRSLASHMSNRGEDLKAVAKALKIDVAKIEAAAAAEAKEKAKGKGKKAGRGKAETQGAKTAKKGGATAAATTAKKAPAARAKPGKGRRAAKTATAATATAKDQALDDAEDLDDEEEAEADDDFGEDMACRVCKCTEHNACAGGCSWVQDDLCSRCDEFQEAIHDHCEDEPRSDAEIFTHVSTQSDAEDCTEDRVRMAREDLVAQELLFAVAGEKYSATKPQGGGEKASKKSATPSAKGKEKGAKPSADDHKPIDLATHADIAERVNAYLDEFAEADEDELLDSRCGREAGSDDREIVRRVLGMMVTCEHLLFDRQNRIYRKGKPSADSPLVHRILGLCQGAGPAAGRTEAAITSAVRARIVAFLDALASTEKTRAPLHVPRGHMKPDEVAREITQRARTIEFAGPGFDGESVAAASARRLREFEMDHTREPLATVLNTAAKGIERGAHLKPAKAAKKPRKGDKGAS